jgi:hypothetical protein
MAGNGLLRGCGSSSRSLQLLAGNGSSQAKLQLCLCGSEQRLVHLRLVGVKGDVRGRRVGVALKHDLLVGLDLKETSELYSTVESV